MASLSLSDFKTVSRDRLYFDKFAYCVHFHMNEVCALRNQTHESIDLVIESRAEYAKYAREKNWGGSWAADSIGLLHNKELRRQNCHGFLDFMEAAGPHKLVISINWGYYYTNSLTDADRIVNEFDYASVQRLTRAVVTHPKNTVKLRKSKYKYRSYFRDIMLTPENKKTLAGYLTAQSDIKISPALVSWLYSGSVWCRASFFIDYANESDVTMLGLFLDRPFRKTMPIVSGDK